MEGHYSKKFIKYRMLAIVFGVLALLSSIPPAMINGMIRSYNDTCATTSCDGSTCDGCTAESAPGLFVVMYIGIAFCIILVILCIIFVALAVKNHELIPYTPEEIAQREAQKEAQEKIRIESIERTDDPLDMDDWNKPIE